MNHPFTVPSHIRQESLGLRDTFHIRFWDGGEALGELTKGSEDYWYWNDAVMGKHWTCGPAKTIMGPRLRQRFHPRYPQEKVRKLWPLWLKCFRKYGRNREPTTKIARCIARLISMSVNTDM